MVEGMSKIVVETMVRKTLRDIQDSPERSIRNLLDMAIQFSKGRFQKSFLETARKMLDDDKSEYYPLVQDVVLHTKPEKLLKLGMNLGYNSCTLGATTIREQKQQHGYHISWAIAFEMDEDRIGEYGKQYSAKIEEGEQIGVNSWLLFMDDNPVKALSIIEKHPDSAFFLFCKSKFIVEGFVERLSVLDNVMTVLSYDDLCSEACGRLRKEKLVYGVYYIYGECDTEEIVSGDMFCATQQLHPAATILIPAHDCSKNTVEQVYQFVVEARSSQKYRTLAWDLYGDHCFIDQIISGDAHFVCFDKDGRMCDTLQKVGDDTASLFSMSLSDIFRKYLS